MTAGTKSGGTGTKGPTRLLPRMGPAEEYSALMPPGSTGLSCASRVVLTPGDTSAACDFPDAWPAPLVCARAAKAIITVRTATNGAILGRTLALRVSLRVVRDLLCHGIRGPVSAVYLLSWYAETSAQNRATFQDGRKY